jgi:hypothetical protein
MAAQQIVFLLSDWEALNQRRNAYRCASLDPPRQHPEIATPQFKKLPFDHPLAFTGEGNWYPDKNWSSLD